MMTLIDIAWFESNALLIDIIFVHTLQSKALGHSVVFDMIE